MFKYFRLPGPTPTYVALDTHKCTLQSRGISPIRAIIYQRPTYTHPFVSSEERRAALWFIEPDQKLHIHFEPGTRYSYSGEGFILLQFAIEHGGKARD